MTKTIHTTYTAQQASMEKIATAIAPILGVPVEVEDHFGEPRIDVTLAQGWYVDCSLSVRFGGQGDLFVEVSAASMDRPPAAAVAFAATYSNFARAACLAEAIHGGEIAICRKLGILHSSEL